MWERLAVLSVPLTGGTTYIVQTRCITQAQAAIKKRLSERKPSSPSSRRIVVSLVQHPVRHVLLDRLDERDRERARHVGGAGPVRPARVA